ncbi:MAG TPA: phosphate ABC transporter substrate-binding/OmpA family protein [Oculatellaceae cyanobacterium]
MNRNLIGALLILFLGLCGIAAYKLITGYITEKQGGQASDSKVNTTIRMGGDSYLGYFFINSPEMKRQAAKRGLAVDFTNDGGTYAPRLEKFNKGEYDCIVLPINSYIQHGLKYNYPGVIVASIAESKGADAIVGFANKLPTGKISDLNDASLKIVYTGESPSSFLLDLTIVDFDLFNLTRTDTWRQEVNGSDQAYQRAKNHDGDVFVMWEPDVSRALHDVDGLKPIWGSDGFNGYIVDVFVFRRDFVSSHREDLVSFFEAYFNTMKSYYSDHQRMVDDMKQATGLKQEEIEPMLKKIAWHDLHENASHEFGLNTGAGNTAVEGVVNTIIACTNVLVKTGKLKKDPLGDPYKIVNSSILKSVQGQLPAEIGSGARKHEFANLSPKQWRNLHEIGVMRVEPISFKQGTSELSSQGDEDVDHIAESLANNYPNDRVMILGHTGAGSDEKESVRLSQERAEAVMQRLIAVHQIPANRMLAKGMGSSSPPPRRPDENQRAYMYRFPRVEFKLYADN